VTSFIEITETSEDLHARFISADPAHSYLSTRYTPAFPHSKESAYRLIWNQLQNEKLRDQAHLRMTENALARLEEFETLKENWDSYGASIIDLKTIEEAREVLRFTGKENLLKSTEDLEFYPIPTVSGGITIYFVFESKEVRIKLTPNQSDRVVYRVDKINPDDYSYEQRTYDRDQLPSHFLWLVGGNNLSCGVSAWNQYLMKTTSTLEYVGFILTCPETFGTKPSNLVHPPIWATETIAGKNPLIGANIAAPKILWVETQVAASAGDVIH